MNPIVIPALFFGLLAPSDLESVDLRVVGENGGRTYVMELADDPVEQLIGLMHRDDLAMDRGMLFLYRERQQVAFWTRNVPFPLDILFLDDCGRVVALHENAPPDDGTEIAPKEKVRAVLELRGGASKRDDISRSDWVDLSAWTGCAPSVGE